VRGDATMRIVADYWFVVVTLMIGAALIHGALAS
jgi:hypothetical protein